MSQKNKVKTPDNKKAPSPQKASAAPNEASWKQRIQRSPFFLITWVLFALFSLFIYGDVFYMCEQYGFFAFDSTLMKNVLDTSFGWYVCIGCFLLLTFKYPLLGAIVWGGMLCLIARLTYYALPIPTRFKVVSLLPSLVIVALLMQKNENIYYYSEPAVVYLYPLTALLIVALLALVRKAVALVRKAQPAPQSAPGFANSLLQLVLLLAVFVGFSAVALSAKENVLLTARMQRLMQQEKWDEMVATAQKAANPSRPVAAYYALALSQKGELSDRLFGISYQYPLLDVYKNGELDFAGELYQHDANFYAGLIQTAYHNSMEYLVMNGPSIDKLKRLFLCSLLDGEEELARKYLHVLRQVPFEGSFCDKYAPMLDDRSLLEADVEMKKVLELKPVKNTFETNFQTPLFLGYNVALSAGRSMRALEHSILACLYAKMLPHAVERIISLQGTLPRVMEEALMLYAVLNPNRINTARINPLVQQRLRQFLSDTQRIKGDKREKARLLKENYQDFYPYYYYYENLPDKSANNQNDAAKGGVN